VTTIIIIIIALGAYLILIFVAGMFVLGLVNAFPCPAFPSANHAHYGRQTFCQTGTLR
jgi:hypothetical protein